MKHFTLKMKSMLCMLLTFFGAHAHAQIVSIMLGGENVPVVHEQTIEVKDVAGTSYSGRTANFDAEKIATELGLNSIADADQYIVNPSNWEAVVNSSDGWRNGAGDLCGWGDITEESRGYCVKISEPETGVIDYLGAHHNGVWNEGDVFTAYWTFVGNGMAALVKVVVNFENPSIMVNGQKVPIVDTQYVETVDTVGITYAGRTAEFDVAAVCEALGIESIDAAKLFILNLTTGEAVENTTDGWRNGDGDATGWGDITEETRGYCVKISDPASGVIDYLGAHDKGVWGIDERFVGAWVFVANDKAVIVEVDVQFLDGNAGPALPIIDLPEPETDITKLQLVGNASVSLERYYTQGYETSDVAVKVDDIAAAFGLTKEELAGSFNRMIYVDQFSEGTNTGVLNLLTLTDGWLRTYINKETDEMTDEVIGAGWEAGMTDIFIQKMSYNHETDEVTFVMGQMPEKQEKGNVRFVNLYVVYGDKAYVIKCTVNFVEPPYNGLEDMNKVGEETIAVSQQPTNDYSFVTFNLDLEAIAALLGAENTADIQMQGLDMNGGLSNDHTANNGGWWLTSEGVITNWGSTAAFFVEPAANNTWTEFHVGQYPDVSKGGEVHTAKLYLTYGGNYYEVTVNFTIEEKQEIDTDELHVVAQRTITIYQELNDTDYAWSEGVEIPYEYLIETIGTASPVLYGLDIESNEEDFVYTDKYTCTPYPGFWLTNEGEVIGWSASSSPWGMSIAQTSATNALVLNCIQLPGLTKIGDIYNGSFFLANSETGDMVQLNVIYKIVENVNAYEIVGEESLTLAVGGEEEGHCELPTAKIAELLGFEAESDMLGEQCMKAIGENGEFGDSAEPGNGVTLNEAGYMAENANIGIYCDEGMIYTYFNGEEALTEWKANAELCFEKDGKRYLLHVTLVSADIYVGLSKVNAAAGKTATYDLQGRLAKTALKGIFIQNGKKVVK